MKKCEDHVSYFVPFSQIRWLYKKGDFLQWIFVFVWLFLEWICFWISVLVGKIKGDLPFLMLSSKLIQGGYLPSNAPMIMSCFFRISETNWSFFLFCMKQGGYYHVPCDFSMHVRGGYYPLFFSWFLFHVICCVWMKCVFALYETLLKLYTCMKLYTNSV